MYVTEAYSNDLALAARDGGEVQVSAGHGEGGSGHVRTQSHSVLWTS